jgi:hypothetical protein
LWPCHFPYKSILRQKLELWENSNIEPFKKYNPQKNPLKQTKNPSRYYYYNSIIITNLKFQHKRKISDSFKNPHIKKIKIDLLLLLLPSRGQKPLSYNESKHNVLAFGSRQGQQKE